MATKTDSIESTGRERSGSKGKFNKPKNKSSKGKFSWNIFKSFFQTRHKMTPADRVSPLLTDFYQVTMTLSYFQQGRHNSRAIFDVFFRKNPFKGHYTLFGGLNEVAKFISNFEITHEEARYLCGPQGLKLVEENWNDKQCMDVPFYEYLRNLQSDIKELKIVSLAEGSAAFPRVPMMRIEGPLGLCQLMETPILNLTGFASLVTTNASRMVDAARGRGILEFGLRRAQGPGGGMVASKYAVIGGFAATSNCLVGFKSDIRIAGTMAHSFICSFQGIKILSFAKNLENKSIQYCNHPEKGKSMSAEDFYENVNRVKGYMLKDGNIFSSVGVSLGTNMPIESELFAFVTYAVTYPGNFLALVDSYDSLGSGVPNFLFVSAVLVYLGYAPRGIRLDSGDLRSLSFGVKGMYEIFEKKLPDILKYLLNLNSEKIDEVEFKKRFKTKFSDVGIVASNDLNEEILTELFDDNTCPITLMGIGTHLATCQAQPALGIVYKLVEIDGTPCIKLSNDSSKQTLPGRKEAYRLFIETKGLQSKMKRTAVADVLALATEKKEELFGEQAKDVTFLWVSNQKTPKKVTLEWNGNNSQNKNKNNVFAYNVCEKLYIDPLEDSQVLELQVADLQKRVKEDTKPTLTEDIKRKKKVEKDEDDLYPVLYSPGLSQSITELEEKLKFA